MQIFFHLTTAANDPSDRRMGRGRGRGGGVGVGGAERGAVGVQSNFRKACLSAGSVEHGAAEKTEGDIEKV